jgi:uncharacterized integral membrane protein
MSYIGPPQQYPYPQQSQVEGISPAQAIRSFISEPRVIGALALVIIGGIMIMISIFMGFVSICETSSAFGSTYTICSSAGPGGRSYLGISMSIGMEFAYGYLLLAFGVLVLVFAVLIPVLRKKNLAAMTWIFGMLGIIIALILLLHFILRDSASVDYFGGMAYSTSVLPGVGFFMAIIGGVLVIVGGIILGKQISKLPQYAASQTLAATRYEAHPHVQAPQPPPPAPPTD